jgi:hypothetical protein
MKRIQLGHHRNRKYKYPLMWALVDDSDYEWLNQWRWSANRDNLTGMFYAVRHSPLVDGKRTLIQMHGLILDTPKGMHTDHIDHDTLNNQRSNLRVATNSQNQGNQKLRADNKSGYKGVSWNKKEKKWAAKMIHQGKQIFVGYFVDPKEASVAHSKASKQYFGEFVPALPETSDKEI